MALIPYNPRGMTPWFDFDRLFQDFDRTFSQPAAYRSENKGWMPAVDIYEDDKEIVLTADLPGMDEKDLDVSVRDNHLTIQGQRKFENEEKRDNYHRVERRYGSFQRTFALPENVDSDRIAAKYEKGQLRLSLPKLERPKNARKIELAK